MNFLQAWDIGASDGMELLHRQEAWLTPLMHFITALGSLILLRVVTILSALFFLFIGKWRTAVCLVAAMLVALAITDNVKPWVNRPRPDLRWVEAQDKSATPGFPSGHAVLSMAVYGTLALSLAALMESRRTAGILIAAGLFQALLIGFTRMYLGVHYMSDVLGGLCAGLGCALLFRWIDLKWTGAGASKPAKTTLTTAPFQPPPPPRALEPMQSSSGEQIQT